MNYTYDQASYLDPIIAKYGQHEGLNADWNTMAWPIGKMDAWILDDESTDRDAPTVSVVQRIWNDAHDECEIAVMFQGSVSEALEFARNT